MSQYGPGPIIHGQDVNDPERYIVQHQGGPPQLLTPLEIAQLPIAHQWFTGTVNGLLCSWWSRDVAEQQAMQRGTLLGQVKGIDGVPVLCDAHGRPLKAG